MPSEGGALPSVGWFDHWAFWENGYDAVMVADGAAPRSDVLPQQNLDFDWLGSWSACSAWSKSWPRPVSA